MNKDSFISPFPVSTRFVFISFAYLRLNIVTLLIVVSISLDNWLPQLFIHLTILTISFDCVPRSKDKIPD